MKRYLNLNLLLIALPLALLARFGGGSEVAIFILSALAIIPLSDLIGNATEVLAEKLGPQAGGLLNATLGNAAELIITIFALREGLVELVRASIIGSILGNLLLVTGMSMLAGGLRHGLQTFDRRGAARNATLMILAVLTIAIPSFFDPAVINGTRSDAGLQREVFFTVGIAGVMLVLYVLSTIYALRHPAPLPDTVGKEGEPPTPTDIRNAILTLIAATIGIVVMSEILVSSVEPVVKQIGLSEFFVGIIIVPLIGNIAEHVVAVEIAMKNRMDLSLNISIGSSLQVALCVAPVLVFISLLFPVPLLLVFNRYELIVLATASAVAILVSQDGESNWLEGVELLAVYLMIALAFFVVPATG
jgi:Ca2+:H+ antiporter